MINPIDFLVGLPKSYKSVASRGHEARRARRHHRTSLKSVKAYKDAKDLTSLVQFHHLLGSDNAITWDEYHKYSQIWVLIAAIKRQFEVTGSITAAEKEERLNGLERRVLNDWPGWTFDPWTVYEYIAHWDL